MGYPVLAGALFATGFLGAPIFIGAWKTFRAKAFRGQTFRAKVFRARPQVPPPIPPKGKFYPGGFDRAMTRREAALILGVSEDVVLEKIKEAHRRAMLANHPDRGGSHYLAYKINDAKDELLK